MSDPAGRLDSWKAIADYLGRDVRTARRWEALGLPVRRVAGGRGHSVFAYATEIDEWMRRDPAASADAASPAATADNVSAMVPASQIASAPIRRRVTRSPWRAIAAAVIVIAGVAAWRVIAPSAADGFLNVAVTPAGVVARALDGAERWHFDFSPAQIVVLPSPSDPSMVTGERSGVVAATSYTVDRATRVPSSGVLREFSMTGQLRHAFSFDDRWTFGAGRTFDLPWVITAQSVEASYGRVRTVVSAHHFTWWPSVVTVLDERWQREATFVNSGWVSGVEWLSPTRLLISGFNQSHDGGMLALLDADHAGGSSPDASGEYACANCPAGHPLMYIVMPRSELNRVSGSAFNQAFLEAGKTSLVVHTSEVDRPGDSGALIDAIYDFSPSIELLDANYGAKYWDKHRALELAGVLKHSRAECPERDGPPLIQVWTPSAGWKDVRPSRRAPTLPASRP